MTGPKMTKEVPNDAISLLKRDHKIVDRLFDLFDEASERRDKKAAAIKICKVLAIHMAIEEELLYPQAHKALPNDKGVNEAEVEHVSAKVLIADIESLNPADDKYDATVTVLGEYIRHHVKEEETEMFPQLRRTDLDLEALGSQLAARRLELLAQENIDEAKLPIDADHSVRGERKNGTPLHKTPSAAASRPQRDRPLNH